MKLNKIEFFLMDNFVRNSVQEHIEIKRLRAFSNLPTDKKVLEIGCGTGNAAQLIKKYFKTKRITGIDLDERMVAIAKRKNKDKTISFEVQDAADLKYKNNSFDAVFDLGVIHHIPHWKECLKELKRVVKPQGQLIIEDLSIESFSTPLGKVMKKVLDHPYNAMYKEEEFVKYLEKIGFRVVVYKKYNTIIKYFIVIAERK